MKLAAVGDLALVIGRDELVLASGRGVVVRHDVDGVVDDESGSAFGAIASVITRADPPRIALLRITSVERRIESSWIELLDPTTGAVESRVERPVRALLAFHPRFDVVYVNTDGGVAAVDDDGLTPLGLREPADVLAPFDDVAVAAVHNRLVRVERGDVAGDPYVGPSPFARISGGDPDRCAVVDVAGVVRVMRWHAGAWRVESARRFAPDAIVDVDRARVLVQGDDGVRLHDLEGRILALAPRATSPCFTNGNAVVVVDGSVCLLDRDRIEPLEGAANVAAIAPHARGVVAIDDDERASIVEVDVSATS